MAADSERVVLKCNGGLRARNSRSRQLFAAALDGSVYFNPEERKLYQSSLMQLQNDKSSTLCSKKTSATTLYTGTLLIQNDPTHELSITEVVQCECTQNIDIILSRIHNNYIECGIVLYYVNDDSVGFVSVSHHKDQTSWRSDKTEMIECIPLEMVKKKIACLIAKGNAFILPTSWIGDSQPSFYIY